MFETFVHPRIVLLASLTPEGVTVQIAGARAQASSSGCNFGALCRIPCESYGKTNIKYNFSMLKSYYQKWLESCKRVGARAGALRFLLKHRMKLKHNPFSHRFFPLG